MTLSSRLAGAAVAASTLLAACSSGAPAQAAPTAAAAAPTVAAPTVAAPTVAAPTVAAPTVAAPTATAGTSAAPAPSKVLVVVEENHTASAATRGMPYLASLGRTYGYTTAYRATSHPSLPNYLAMVGGSTFGVRDDAGPGSHHIGGQSVFDQALAAHHSAKLYAESMPAPCAQSSTNSYAVKHNPWAYFSDAAARAACRRYDVPAGTTSSGALRDDISTGALPTVGMLVPNICNDGHDCSLATADGWLKKWLPLVMNGPDYRAGRLAIIVTFDEDDSSGPNTVLTTVISPATHHVVSHTSYTHFSLTRYAAELMGLRALRSGAAAPSLRPAFHI